MKSYIYVLFTREPLYRFDTNHIKRIMYNTYKEIADTNNCSNVRLNQPLSSLANNCHHVAVVTKIPPAWRLRRVCVGPSLQNAHSQLPVFSMRGGVHTILGYTVSPSLPPTTLRARRRGGGLLRTGREICLGRGKIAARTRKKTRSIDLRIW